jgi:hypothetical protein
VNDSLVKKTTEQSSNGMPVAVDLLDCGSVAAAAPGFAGVTHVF